MEYTNSEIILTFNAPELFSDSEFVAWLDDSKTVVVSWCKSGTSSLDCGNIIVLYDRGNACGNGMPVNAWRAICHAVEEACWGQSIVWVRLTNFPKQIPIA